MNALLEDERALEDDTRSRRLFIASVAGLDVLCRIALEWVALVALGHVTKHGCAETARSANNPKQSPSTIAVGPY